MTKSTFTSKMAEATIINEKIELSSIYVQKHIPNRDSQEIQMTQSYSDLYMSITNSKEGLIHPIIVRADHNGKYELFAGYRRYLVYLDKLESEGETYKSIPARIWPPETSTEKMLLMTIHENNARVDLNIVESLEAKIALVPFFLNCGVPGRFDINKGRGYDILKIYNSFLRGESKNYEKMLKIIELTKCENAHDQLDLFFKSIGERERTFYDKANELINTSNEIRYLLQQRRISLRQAKSLRTMKSDTDRTKFIIKIKNERLSSREINKLIRESNIMSSPLKARDALLKYSKDIFAMIENQKKDLTETQYENIKLDLQRIEAILREGR